MTQHLWKRSLQQAMMFLKSHTIWKYGLIMSLLLVMATAVAASSKTYDFYPHADVYYGTPAPAYVTSWRLNVRYGPGTGYGVLTKIANGDSMMVLGHSVAGQWLLIELPNGYQGWVWSEYVSSIQPPPAVPQPQPLQPVVGGKTAVYPPTTATTTASPIGTVTSNRLNLRYGPDTAYDIILKLHKHETVTVLGRNELGTWLYVRTPYGFDGWVWSEYLKLTLPTITQSAPALPLTQSHQCDPFYPTVCIPPVPYDLDCEHVPYTYFSVPGHDPHGFDSDNDQVGCELP